jgi:hypothetical protein
MTNAITINNQDLALRQYKGQMVITFKDIDLVHNRPQGTASRNFRRNRQHFIEGEDYFKICPDEIRRHKIMSISPKVREDIVFITESGYLMLVKSFTDDLSWEVQRQLVKTYFRYKEQFSVSESKQAKEYEYFDKTYNGEPVLTTADIEHITSIKQATIAWWFRQKAEAVKDYYYLEKLELQKFKNENPRLPRLSKQLYAITRSGFVKFCKAYGINMEEPKCFEQKEQPRISAVHRIYDTFCKYYDIKRYQLTEDTAKILKCGENGIVNESCILRKTDNDEYKIFTDPTMPLLERQFTLTENLGRIMAGQLREDANPDINYDQEARLFGIVVMAMSLFFDK